ncbi:MAG TPA: class I SAM-dependent methyltransferase [Polyangiaceae bacterium]
MRFGARPDNLVERLLDSASLLPSPLADTLVGTWTVRTVMVASKLGVFDALEDGPVSAAEVARARGTHAAATEKLLGALVGAGYATCDRGGRYALTRMSRRWMRTGSPLSLHDHMMLMFVAWRWVEHYEEYVRTGRALDVHRDLRDGEWETYQRGMRAIARVSAPEVAMRTPVPRGARAMIDVGGAHGTYSVALCRRHRRLRSTILDLPEAVAASAPLLGAEGLGDRVAHRAGDALRHDYGEGTYDLVFVANLLHHFDDATNRDLMRRFARALRPGGYVVVQEIERVDARDSPSQVGALGDLYFAALSDAGTLAFDQVAVWQKDAGLVPRRPARLFTLPGTGQQAARKPG